MQLDHVGSLDEMITYLLGGWEFELQRENGGTLRVLPDFGKEGMTIQVVEGRTNSEKRITIPVRIPDLGAAGKLTVQYQIRRVKVADGCPTIEAVPNVSAHKAEDGEEIPEIIGHRRYEGHDAITSLQFVRSIHDASAAKISVD